MEALSKLTVNPFDAVAGLMESVLPGTPPANATTAAASTPNATFTEDTLRMIVHNLFTGDSRCGACVLACFFQQEISCSRSPLTVCPVPVPAPHSCRSR